MYNHKKHSSIIGRNKFEFQSSFLIMAGYLVFHLGIQIFIIIERIERRDPKIPPQK